MAGILLLGQVQKLTNKSNREEVISENILNLIAPHYMLCPYKGLVNESKKYSKDGLFPQMLMGFIKGKLKCGLLRQDI